MKSFVSVPKSDYNTGVLRGFKEDGLPLIDFCGLTLRRHRKRLQEAHVFRANEFHGAERGVTLYINNQILTVYCKFHLKYYNLDNQLDGLQGRKKLLDNNILTINKYNIINKEQRSSLSLKSKELFITGTPLSKIEKKNQAAEKKTSGFKPAFRIFTLISFQS